MIKPYAFNANEICVDVTPIAFLTSGAAVIIKNKKNGTRTVTIQLPVKN